MTLFDNENFTLTVKSIPRVEDYFDFPSSLIAFGESLSSSFLFEPFKGVFFRKRGQYLTLITYFCSAEELRACLASLKRANYEIKSLNFVHKDMAGFKTKFYMNEFWVDMNWNIEDILSKYRQKERYNIRRDIKRSNEKYKITLNGLMTQVEAMNLFEGWYKFAKNRHFMVMRGHYLKYIQRYFEKRNNVNFLTFRRNDGLLFGFAGFEIFQDKAQLTIMKHLGGDYSFPRFFWVKTVQEILETGVSKLFCGSTADDLKEALGFNKDRSYKLEI